MSEGIALHWRLLPSRYNLIGTECRTCSTKFFPPRNICPDCRRKSDIHEFQFSGNGEVYSHTVIRATPTGHEYQKPYLIGIIKLEEGPLVTAQIVNCGIHDVEIGMPVEQCLRKVIADDSHGIIRYAYKFKPKKT